MSWIRVVSDEQATGRLRASFDAARGRAGRVFNIVRQMSPNPALLDASMAFYVAAMKQSRTLSRAQCELLATVVSRLNGCVY